MVASLQNEREVLLRPRNADIGAGMKDAYHQPHRLRRRERATGGA